MHECSKRLSSLPPYLFTQIDKLKKEAYDKKYDVIDLGMGNPDMQTPQDIVERLCDTIMHHGRTHRYPQARGMHKLRQAASAWLAKRFGVSVDPDKEVLALIGSKEGIAHFCQAFLDPRDIVLVPDPSYPVYYNGTILAGGGVSLMPLLEKNQYLPDLTKIPAKIAKKAKIMFLNYPNNPTAGVVEDISFFKEVIQFAKKYDIIVCHDSAYSELTFDGYEAPSFLQVPGAKDVGVEFYSFSKTFAMPGWRIGFVAGNPALVGALEKFKAFVDYGIPTFVQLSAVYALEHGEPEVQKMRQTYKRRMDRCIKEFRKVGWPMQASKGTLYLWSRIPEEFLDKSGSIGFCERLIRETGIVFAPGRGFGVHGEGYVRIALVTHEDRFHDAAIRFKRFVDGKRK